MRQRLERCLSSYQHWLLFQGTPFQSRHPYDDDSQLPVALVPGKWTPFPASTDSRHTCSAQTFVEHKTLIHIKLKWKNMEMNFKAGKRHGEGKCMLLSG